MYFDSLYTNNTPNDINMSQGQPHFGFNGQSAFQHHFPPSSLQQQQHQQQHQQQPRNLQGFQQQFPRYADPTSALPPTTITPTTPFLSPLPTQHQLASGIYYDVGSGSHQHQNQHVRHQQHVHVHRQQQQHQQHPFTQSLHASSLASMHPQQQEQHNTALMPSTDYLFPQLAVEQLVVSSATPSIRSPVHNTNSSGGATPHHPHHHFHHHYANPSPVIDINSSSSLSAFPLTSSMLTPTASTPANTPKASRCLTGAALNSTTRVEAGAGAAPTTTETDTNNALIAYRFRTQLCRGVFLPSSSSSCPFGPIWCMFAHSEEDKRTLGDNLADGLTTMAAIDAFRERAHAVYQQEQRLLAAAAGGGGGGEQQMPHQKLHNNGGGERRPRKQKKHASASNDRVGGDSGGKQKQPSVASAERSEGMARDRQLPRAGEGGDTNNAAADDAGRGCGTSPSSPVKVTVGCVGSLAHRIHQKGLAPDSGSNTTAGDSPHCFMGSGNDGRVNATARNALMTPPTPPPPQPSHHHHQVAGVEEALSSMSPSNNNKAPQLQSASSEHTTVNNSSSSQPAAKHSAQQHSLHCQHNRQHGGAGDAHHHGTHEHQQHQHQHTFNVYHPPQLGLGPNSKLYPHPHTTCLAMAPTAGDTAPQHNIDHHHYHYHRRNRDDEPCATITSNDANNSSVSAATNTNSNHRLSSAPLAMRGSVISASSSLSPTVARPSMQSTTHGGDGRGASGEEAPLLRLMRAAMPTTHAEAILSYDAQQQQQQQQSHALFLQQQQQYQQQRGQTLALPNNPNGMAFMANNNPLPLTTTAAATSQHTLSLASASAETAAELEQRLEQQQARLQMLMAAAMADISDTTMRLTEALRNGTTSTAENNATNDSGRGCAQAVGGNTDAQQYDPRLCAFPHSFYQASNTQTVSNTQTTPFVSGLAANGLPMIASLPPQPTMPSAFAASAQQQQQQQQQQQWSGSGGGVFTGIANMAASCHYETNY